MKKSSPWQQNSTPYLLFKSCLTNTNDLPAGKNHITAYKTVTPSQPSWVHINCLGPALSTHLANVIIGVADKQAGPGPGPPGSFSSPAPPNHLIMMSTPPPHSHPAGSLHWELCPLLCSALLSMIWSIEDTSPPLNLLLYCTTAVLHSTLSLRAALLSRQIIL